MSNRTTPEQAFESMLAIWHDVAPGMADEFETWHSQQHLPERVTIPGITLARRYKKAGAEGEEYCTVLTIEDTDVLRSDEYLRRLNAPTPWTIEVSGNYMNFYRCAIAKGFSSLGGRAPFLVSIRIDADQNELSNESLTALWDDMKGALSWSQSLGVVEGAATKTKTSETSARNRTSESLTDLVIFAELSTHELAEKFRKDALHHVHSHFNKADTTSACYQLQFEIDERIAAPLYAANLRDTKQYGSQATTELN